MHQLLANLVQLPGAVRGMGGGVNLPPQLPPILRFGGNERGPYQSQAYTGAAVPHPLNLVTGGDIQPFTPPTYANLGGQAPVHPVVAALAAALTGIHAPSPAPVGAPPSRVVLGPPQAKSSAAGSLAGPTLPNLTAPGNGSVAAGLAQLPTLQGQAPSGPGLASIIAQFAQRGQRVGGPARFE